MNANQFPPGWSEERVRDIIDYYESQTEEEAVAEYEAAGNDRDYILMQVPKELVSAVTELSETHKAKLDSVLESDDRVSH